jgi:ABC-type phosphate transport system permease subunit
LECIIRLLLGSKGNLSEVDMSTLLVQLVFSVVVIAIAVGMMVYLYRYAMRKINQDAAKARNQQLVNQQALRHP